MDPMPLLAKIGFALTLTGTVLAFIGALVFLIAMAMDWFHVGN
jgi:hypothetical protein